MIQLIKRGDYTLMETKQRTKILALDSKEQFAWLYVKGIGDVLIRTRKKHKPINILAVGKYRVLDVEDEPNMADVPHLELSLSNGMWQDYLLVKGLPTHKDKRRRIIPSDEVITRATVY